MGVPVLTMELAVHSRALFFLFMTFASFTTVISVFENLLLPIGSLIYLLFCATKWGWGFEKYLEETNTGSGLKMSKAFKPYFQFALPVPILVILIQGLI